MSKKFGFLTSESIKKKINTKSFKIINIVLCIIIVLAINFDSIIKLFGGDFDEPVNVYIVDEADFYEGIKREAEGSLLESLNNFNAHIVLADKDIEELKQTIIDEENGDIIVRISEKDIQVLDDMYDVEIISYEKISALLYQNLSLAINKVKVEKALELSDIDKETLDAIQKDVEITRTILDEENKDDEFMELVGAIAVIAFILPIFMLLTLVVQVIGAEINEEKTSRGMEIIISSVSPEVHFLSKLIASNVFAILQGFLLGLYAFIGGVIRVLTSSGLSEAVSTTASELDAGSIGQVNEYIRMLIKSDVMSRLNDGIPCIILLIILSFIGYSLFIGILASITTSMEDYNQIQTPVMIFLMAGYFLAIYGTLFDGSLFITIMSFIPFISGILAPVSYIMGNISYLGLFISTLIQGFTCFILYKYGLKVYKVGILNYSSSKLWTKIFNALKSK